MLSSLLPVTKNLIIINVLIFFGTVLWEADPSLRAADVESILDLKRDGLSAWPPGSPFFRPFQIVTGMFMHAGIGHLFFNMLGMFFFGSMVERTLGPQRYFTLYMAAGIGGLLVFWLTGYLMDTQAPVLGASGAVYGVLLSLAYTNPDTRVQLLFPPIPIKLGYLAIGLVAFDLFRGWTGTSGNVASFAHIGGALVGLGLTAWWTRRG